MQFLPGGGMFGGADVPPPPPPPPKMEDPEVIDARRKQRLADLERRGRAASILTPSEGLGAANVAQPRAGAQLLGQ